MLANSKVCITLLCWSMSTHRTHQNGISRTHQNFAYTFDTYLHLQYIPICLHIYIFICIQLYMGGSSDWKKHHRETIYSVSRHYEDPTECPLKPICRIWKCVDPSYPSKWNISRPSNMGALRKLDFHFLSNWMGYDRCDGFPFDFKTNEFPFGSKSKGKLSPRSYPIQLERKWQSRFLSVGGSSDWKTSAIRCISVRETILSVSRHNETPIERPLEPIIR